MLTIFFILFFIKNLKYKCYLKNIFKIKALKISFLFLLKYFDMACCFKIYIFEMYKYA